MGDRSVFDKDPDKLLACNNNKTSKIALPNFLRTQVLNLVHKPDSSANNRRRKMYTTQQNTYFWLITALYSNFLLNCIEFIRERVTFWKYTKLLVLFQAEAPQEPLAIDLQAP